ncbi:MAG: hypothetical protein KKE17_02680 [Proteobacteria bacterium]|nr:hypothetical protein [Pseudomonadota bacterium]MBU1708887.1 hypothetical protein [Pseudomonadota bacterium]
MVDPSDSDFPEASEDTSIGLDTDWGEDWESAFQAEDQMFGTDSGLDDGNDKFFLEDTDGTTDPLAKSQDEDQSDPTAGTSFSDRSIGIITGDAPPTFNQLRQLFTIYFINRYQTGKAWLHSLPPLKRIAVGTSASAGVILLLAGLIFIFSGSDQEVNQQIASSVSTDIPSVTSSNTAAESSLSESVNASSTLEEQPQIIEPVAKQKWHFSSFIIPASINNQEKDIAFIIVDLTFLVGVTDEDELPDDKRSFVREIVYHFYINRPYYELNRYSLARGEMGRKLMDWIKKQWPDTPIQNVQFDKYQVS